MEISTTVGIANHNSNSAKVLPYGAATRNILDDVRADAVERLDRRQESGDHYF